MVNDLLFSAVNQNAPEILLCLVEWPRSISSADELCVGTDACQSGRELMGSTHLASHKRSPTAQSQRHCQQIPEEKSFLGW